jgi:predicted TIM-barrel fold metal-dependent hydrolase
MAISQHLGLVASLWELLRRDPTPQKGIFTSQPPLRLAETIAFWILPGVLARFPDLKIVLVEPGLGWVPFYLDTLDSMAAGPYDFPAIDDKPSAYFHRQMYLTFVDDPRGLEHRYDLGVDRIMWSTDFPHPATSWPNSQTIVEKNFADIPEEERSLVVAGNAAALYGL